MASSRGDSTCDITLNATFLASADGGVIGMEHILHEMKREFAKISKLWNEQDLRRHCVYDERF